ncbi:YadA family autotransporter adhesin [Burkholderia lata]|uniref:YadA family autotransporter adhesin n=1 Tax=Burkholderia lata (strain ATCC 17760 / DSM 23089 / LMG 22485 / NCIMB 9086 / R18194 / 383) TaxID=482957 RepID=UPI0020C5C7EB|nr:YadA-like family protein [Burkholderia lata]
MSSIGNLSSVVSTLQQTQQSVGNQNASVGSTVVGGGTNGVAQTQGAMFNNTATSTVQAVGLTVANGMDTTATGLGASAGTVAGVNGASTTTAANGATAYGAYAQAQSDHATAVGFRAVASQAGAVAIGYQAQAMGDPTVAIGDNSLASGNNAVALGASASATANNAVALGAGSIAGQANTVSMGAPGSERRITNVAPGVSPTDAVNMSQLRQVQQGVTDVARQAYSGIAAATALTMIPEVDPGKTIAVGIGSSSFKGYGATAIGVSVRITDNLKMKAGVGIAGSSQTYGVGASYQW